MLQRSNNPRDQARAAGDLSGLASHSADNRVKIVAAGAIPPLVALLGPQSSERVQQNAARALLTLASNNIDNCIKIRSHGAVPALSLLLQSTNEDVKSVTRDVLNMIIG